MVQAGELVAIYYGRDYQAAQQSYLYALKNKEAQSAGVQAGANPGTSQLQLDAALDNLLSLGVSEVQVKELAQTRETTRDIELRAPMTGFILLSNVYTGLRFERGAELLRLADLKQVWVTADLFGGQGEHVKPGTKVNLQVPNRSKTFLARVSDSLPQFDQAARATRVRLEVENPGYELRPGMFVDVGFPVSLPETLHVPVDAVVDSGLRKTVYVESAGGSFEPREVRTGWQLGDRVQILSGLSPGERIVRSGAFLLDSETRMKAPADSAQKTAAATTSGSPIKDPVCGMKIPASSANSYSSSYEGAIFHFCSKNCKEKFESDKRRYASAARSL
jgi:Cu(I)/Ag(I) efflux system membrane fusion protein